MGLPVPPVGDELEHLNFWQVRYGREQALECHPVTECLGRGVAGRLDPTFRRGGRRG